MSNEQNTPSSGEHTDNPAKVLIWLILPLLFMLVMGILEYNGEEGSNAPTQAAPPPVAVPTPVAPASPSG